MRPHKIVMMIKSIDEAANWWSNLECLKINIFNFFDNYFNNKFSIIEPLIYPIISIHSVAFPPILHLPLKINCRNAAKFAFFNSLFNPIKCWVDRCSQCIKSAGKIIGGQCRRIFKQNLSGIKAQNSEFN